MLLNAQKFCPKLPFENRFNLHGIYLEQQTGTANIVQGVPYLKFWNFTCPWRGKTQKISVAMTEKRFNDWQETFEILTLITQDLVLN